MENWLTILTPEAAYCSTLTHRWVTNAEGWSRLEPTSGASAPTGCIIMDRVLHLLHANNCPSYTRLAGMMGVKEADLAGVIRIFSGMNGADFVIAYRMERAKELLACTDMEMEEIARRTGYSSVAALNRTFAVRCKQPPVYYRRCYRPGNFRELYRW